MVLAGAMHITSGCIYDIYAVIVLPAVNVMSCTHIVMLSKDLPVVTCISRLLY